MNKGFVSLGTAAVITFFTVTAVGGTYGVYKYAQVANEKEGLEQELAKEKELQELRDKVQDYENDETKIENERDVEDEKAGDVSGNNTASSTFFIEPLTANVRPCENSLNSECSPIGQYEQNTEIKLPYADLGEMPQWVSVSWDGQDAFINKVVLSEEKISAPINPTKPQNVEPEPETESEPRNQIETSAEEEEPSPDNVQEEEKPADNEEPVSEAVDETEVVNDNGLDVEVLYSKQTPFYDDESDYYQYGYGGYQIVMNIKATGEDIFIPQTTTDNSGAVVSVEYEITGSDLVGDYELNSEFSCGLKNDGRCKFENDRYREMKVTVYLYPEEDGIFGVKFTRLNYFHEGEMKSIELNESTSRINVRGVN